MDETHVLGVDGGGTATRCVIATASGHILARGTGGPSNPLTAGVDSAVAAIGAAVKQASNRCGIDRFAASVMGIAGTERASAMEDLGSGLRGRGFKRFRLTSDAEVALAGATGCRPGVVVISGTGSIAYGENGDGDRARSGGWGWRLGDEGSGYDIGNKALIAALRDYDGRGAPTLLRGMVEGELGLGDPSELVDRVYNEGMGSEEVAALASLVGKAADEGDGVALTILRGAGEELGIAASSVINRLGLQGGFTVGIVGGVFKLSPVIQDSLSQEIRRVAPSCSITPPLFPPEVGAVLLALKEIGVELDQVHLDRVKASQEALMEGSR